MTVQYGVVPMPEEVVEFLLRIENIDSEFLPVEPATERAGGVVGERGVAGECELRCEEQFPVGFPGIGAGGVGEVEGGEREGKEI